MHFFGSERGTLATPTACGTYPVTTTFTPWDSSLPALTSSQFFTLDSGPEGQPCPGPVRPFSPTFQAASPSHVPGAHSPFEVELRRPDGDQNLAGLTVQTPPGFSGTLKGIPVLPQAASIQLSNPLYSGLAELAAPLCPAASQIGTAVGGVGAGTQPLYVPGKVYLAGPYKGAPLSLLVVLPSVSGPYDLGNAVVRAAIRSIKDRPGDDGLRSTAADHRRYPAADPRRSGSISTGPDSPQPDQLRPPLSRCPGDRNEGATANHSNHFQLANCRGCRLSRSFHEAERRSQSSRPPGHPRRAHRATRGSQPAAHLGHPAQGRAPRQLAHRHDLHPGPVRAGRLPGGSQSGRRR